MSLERKAVLVLWSGKGGSGVSLVTALASLAAIRAGIPDVRLVDACGDQPSIFGVEASPAAGFRQWVQAGKEISVEALDRLSLTADPALRIVPAGKWEVASMCPIETGPLERLSLDSSAAMTVVDAGVADAPESLAGRLAALGHPSILVTRLCYLSIRRAHALGIKPSGIIAIEESGRSITPPQAAEVIGAPLLASLNWDSGLGRAVDAGRLHSRRFRCTRALDRLISGICDSSIGMSDGTSGHAA